MKRGLKEGGLVITVYDDEPIQGRIEKIECGKLTIDVQIPYRGKVTVPEKDAFAMAHYNLKGIDKRTLVWAEYTDPGVYQSYFAEEVEGEAPAVTLDDLYVALQRLEGNEDLYYDWLETTLNMAAPALSEGEAIRPSNMWDEEVYTHFVLDYFDFYFGELEDVKSLIESWRRREVDPILKDRFLDLVDNDDGIVLSEEEIELCRSLLLELSGENLRVKEKLAYCYYGGNEFFSCDWEKARDMFLELLEENPGKAGIYSNTLGYIYYYGRTNGGVPQFEEAFRYFSYGAACGLLESIYKVSDMLKNGYGVPQNVGAAEALISRLYEEEIVTVLKEHEMNKFADIALRMSGFPVYTDEEAYRYALQAQFAIRKRQQAYVYYGDGKVAGAIGKRLEELRPKVEEEPRLVSFDTLLSLVNNNLCPRGSKLLFTMERLGDNKAKVTVAHKDDGMKLLVTLPERSLCYLSDGLEFIVSGVKLKKKSYVQLVDDRLDCIGFDLETDDPIYLDDEYSYVVEEAKDSRETYRMALVVFPGSSKVYSYRCEGFDIGKGDKAIVSTQEGEKEVSVVAVEEYGENDLLLPLERYKHIIRVVERKES